MGETTQDLSGSRPTIANLDDVRPGDLCFTNIGGLVPGVFPVKLGMLAIGERVRIGRLSVDHVIVVTSGSVGRHGLPASDAYTYVGGPVRPDDPYRPPRGVQAMPEGAEYVDLTPDRHWSPRTAYVRLPENYPGQGLDVARIAEEFVAAGVEYSFASYLALAAWRFGRDTPKLERWIDRRQEPRRIELPARGYPISVRLPVEAICSVLADQAWSMTGKRVIEGTAKQAVTPGALALNLWRRPGSIWGGPGILG
jgi:hypothetical protein